MEFICQRCEGRLPHLVDIDTYFWGCRYCKCALAKKGPGAFTKPTVHKRKCPKMPDLQECICPEGPKLYVASEVKHGSSDLCWGECCLKEPSFKLCFPKHILTPECDLTESSF